MDRRRQSKWRKTNSSRKKQQWTSEKNSSGEKHHPPPFETFNLSDLELCNNSFSLKISKSFSYTSAYFFCGHFWWQRRKFSFNLKVFLFLWKFYRFYLPRWFSEEKCIWFESITAAVIFDLFCDAYELLRHTLSLTPT